MQDAPRQNESLPKKLKKNPFAICHKNANLPICQSQLGPVKMAMTRIQQNIMIILLIQM